MGPKPAQLGALDIVLGATSWDNTIDELFKLDSASPPKLWVGGELRPAMSACLATLIMYYGERVDAGEMTEVGRQLRDVIMRGHFAHDAASADETLRRWGRHVFNSFEKDNLHLLAKSTESGTDRVVHVVTQLNEAVRSAEEKARLAMDATARMEEKLSQITTHLAKLEQSTAHIQAMHTHSGGMLVQLMAMFASLQNSAAGAGAAPAPAPAPGEGAEAVVVALKGALERGASAAEAIDATEAAAFAASAVTAPIEANAVVAPPPLAVAVVAAADPPPPPPAEMVKPPTTFGGILTRDTSTPDHLGHTCGAMFCDDLFRESMKDGGGGSRLPSGMLGNAAEVRKERSRAASCISFFLQIANDEEKQLLQARTPSDTTERMRVEGERKKVVRRLHDLLAARMKEAYSQNLAELRQLPTKAGKKKVPIIGRMSVNTFLDYNKPLKALEKHKGTVGIAIRADDTLMAWRKACEDASESLLADENEERSPKRRKEGEHGDGGGGGGWGQAIVSTFFNRE